MEFDREPAYIKMNIKTYESVKDCFFGPHELDVFVSSFHAMMGAAVVNSSKVYEYNDESRVIAIGQVLILVEFLKRNWDLIVPLVKNCKFDVISEEKSSEKD